jgi:cell division septation protein DedD
VPSVSAKPAVVKPAAVPEKRPAATAANGALVQLAAVRSEDAAKSEWQRLSKRLPDLFGQRRPAFSKTEHDGHTLWRIRTGGFADTAQATTFCEKVRAKGVGCSVAEF